MVACASRPTSCHMLHVVLSVATSDSTLPTSDFWLRTSDSGLAFLVTRHLFPAIGLHLDRMPNTARIDIGYDAELREGVIVLKRTLSC